MANKQKEKVEMIEITKTNSLEIDKIISYCYEIKVDDILLAHEGKLLLNDQECQLLVFNNDNDLIACYNTFEIHQFSCKFAAVKL